MFSLQTEGHFSPHPGKTNSLAFSVMREFERWLKRAPPRTDSLLTRDIQQAAFYLGMRGHMTCFDLIVKCFQLQREDVNQDFVNIVRLLIEKKQFKEVRSFVIIAKTYDLASITW